MATGAGRSARCPPGWTRRRWWNGRHPGSTGAVSQLRGAGDAKYNFEVLVRHSDAYPSVADVFYLGAYPFFMLGVLRLGRGRFRRDRAGMLDALIIAAGVGLVFWEFVIKPLVGQEGTPPLTRVVAVGYPASDVLLFGVAVRLLTAAGRRSVSQNLLVAGLGLLIVTDTAYAIMNMTQTYAGGPRTGWSTRSPRPPCSVAARPCSR